ncbi:Lrp/AsnC family transcriptional regulator [Methanobacterium paludis]|jgi:Lrp/AsnC family transcriptional regulator, regulator for asnA, asnC and gidA|uniref:Transcriptional regulator, AsnC family n=1 Tax=Methanobacterium paludis (strain DSM 25820 / JCM 18151 / SWAN1) TaxID=868131 RepID=F6D5F1_METPW|nr:Lrp/AsnC family transcriptional regulator [Methanobacterium paludis]AEG19303.1 transcriptional regulator, AsnC family [Methanobacterium paludis]
MDDIDMEIIRSLIKNSRITISQMSKEIDVPDATISNRLKKLEKNAIKEYTLILDPKALGLKVTAIVIIQTESEKHENVEKELSMLEEVSEVYSISGEYDILIKLWSHSLEELNKVMNSKIRSVDGVEDLTEMIVMERVKEGVVPPMGPK